MSNYYMLDKDWFEDFIKQQANDARYSPEAVQSLVDEYNKDRTKWIAEAIYDGLTESLKIHEMLYKKQQENQKEQ